MTRRACLMGCLLWMGLESVVRADVDPALLESQIKPFVQTYCVGCHGESDAQGGIRLDELPATPDFVKEPLRWSKVIGQVRAKGMPPQDADQPKDEERAQLVNWLSAAISNVDCGAPRPAGRPTLRRLNRVEYNNTLRDLLAIDFQPADDFPADDVGEGFDNIGDVLSISPLLLEKYLEASKLIAERAIVLPVKTDRVKLEMEGEYARSTSKGQSVDEGTAQLLSTPGELYKSLKFPATGDYRFTLRAYGQQAGNEVVRAGIVIDAADPVTIEIPATAEQKGSYEQTLRVEKGSRRIAVRFLNDWSEEKGADGNGADRNLVVDSLMIEGPISVDAPALPKSHQLVFFRPIASDTQEADIRAIVERFVTRAYRRPALPKEVDRLLPLVQLARNEGESTERGIQLVVEAVLASPHFLFKMESDEGFASPGEREVNQFEWATRLSYFLWSTMPDEELFEAARQGKLADAHQRSAQVDRMLADPRVFAFVENFAGQWLQLRNLEVRSPDRDKFPQFNDELRTAMKRETELFFASVLQERRQLVDFLNANYTFVNEPLAKLYGIEGVAGGEFRRVDLKDSPRGGLLTQASVLTITSDPTRTSPVKRGKWVMETILGTPPPNPPPNVPELDAQKELTGSLRQRFEQHRANPACATCHDSMDPLGFGLENFNAIGGWRDTDGEYPVDASGTLPGGASFRGPKELAQILVTQKELFLKTVTQRILVYALGRGLEYYDQCEVDAICRRVAEKGGHLADVIREIVESRPFRFRTL